MSAPETTPPVVLLEAKCPLHAPSALTGQDGSLYYTPSATKFCLLDFTDFPAGTSITVPAKHDFRVGDPVVFEEEKGGKICTELTAGNQYYVVALTPTTLDVSDTKGGTAITITQSGGTSGADTPGVTSGLNTILLARFVRFSPGI